MLNGRHTAGSVTCSTFRHRSGQEEPLRIIIYRFRMLLMLSLRLDVVSVSCSLYTYYEIVQTVQKINETEKVLTINYYKL